MKDTINFCNALGQLCCELCLHFLYSIGDFCRYFGRSSDSNNNPDFELEPSSTRNDRSALELDLNTTQPRLVRELPIQQSIAEISIAPGENQQLHGCLAPIDEENEAGVIQVLDGNYARSTADDPNRPTATLTNSTNLPTHPEVRLEPEESGPSSMQELHFDLASRPRSCGLM